MRRRGSVREVRPGTWEVRVSKGSGSDRRTIHRTVHGTRQDAEAEALRVSLEMGSAPQSGMTLHDYFHAVFLPTRTNLRRGTLQSYRSSFRTRIGPHLGKVQLDAITRPMVQRWVSQLPPRSARNHARVLSAILGGAVDDGFLDAPVPLSRLRFPRIPFEERPRDVWTAGEVSEALTRLEGDPIFPLWLAMVGAGLSRSEACAVTDQDVSVLDGWTLISVTKARTDSDGVAEPKNPYRYRLVPMVEPMGSKLREVLPVGTLWPYTPDNTARHWKRLFSGPLEGLPFVHLNRMRATHDTLLQSAGVPDSINARMHGHSNVQTGYRHYQNAQLFAMLEASRKAGNLLNA